MGDLGRNISELLASSYWLLDNFGLLKFIAKLIFDGPQIFYDGYDFS
jgi:hypothetical protein